MRTILSIIGLTFCFLADFSQETGTFTDIRDGKVYKTVKIGTQWIGGSFFQASHVLEIK